MNKDAVSEEDFSTIVVDFIYTTILIVFGKGIGNSKTKSVTEKYIEDQIGEFLEIYSPMINKFIDPRHAESSDKTINIFRRLIKKVGLKLERKQIMQDGKRFYTYWIDDIGDPDELSVTIHRPIRRKPSVSERNKLTPLLRFSILMRDNFKCVACGRTPSQHNIVLHVDHIQPIKKGGRTTVNNLQTLCHICNLGKHTKLVPV